MGGLRCSSDLSKNNSLYESGFKFRRSDLTLESVKFCQTYTTGLLDLFVLNMRPEW